jgi:hypothetical protein
MERQRLTDIFQRGKYFSTKHDTYFPVYERVFERFIGKGITFVEVGVLDGGSLFMWRDYFQNARVIGIDFNPAVEKWRAHGFEIFVGDQSSPAFWDNFYRQVGPIDVLLDDGGHTNYQQIVTADYAVRNVRDGGVLLVEDIHSSYMKSFGNPSRYSFINFAKHVVDALNSRFPEIAGTPSNDYARRVYSTEFYESIVVCNIDSSLCKVPQLVSNTGEMSHTEDARWQGTAIDSARKALVRPIQLLKRNPLLRRMSLAAYGAIAAASARRRDRGLAKFFR